MLKLNSRAVRVTALAGAAAFALLPMAGASAATENARAYGADATVLGIHLGPLAVSTLGSPDAAVVPLHAPGVADVLGIYSNTSSPTAGTSTANAGTADVNVLGTVLTSYLIHANAVSATCTAVGTAVSGSATVANLAIGNNPVLDLTNVQQQNLITLTGVATVLIGEQITNPDGSLTVNALHIHLLGAANVADIVLGSVTCGPNADVLPVSAFSFQDLPVILGGIALVVLIGFGIRTGVRRLGSAA